MSAELWHALTHSAAGWVVLGVAGAVALVIVAGILAALVALGQRIVGGGSDE